MRLLTVNSVQEQGRVFQQAESVLPQARYWLDGRREGISTWIWWEDQEEFWQGGPDGDKVGELYTNWAHGEPQNNGVCVLNLASGVWEDVFCDSNEYYVCEPF